MALPDKNSLQTLDFGFEGVPFVNIASKSSINLNSLDYGFEGVPFWGPDGSAPPTPTTKRVITSVITT